MGKPKVPLELESGVQNTCTNSIFNDCGDIRWHVTQLHQVRNVHADGIAIVSCFRDCLIIGQVHDFIQGQSPPKMAHIQWLMEVDIKMLWHFELTRYNSDGPF